MIEIIRKEFKFKKKIEDIKTYLSSTEIQTQVKTLEKSEKSGKGNKNSRNIKNNSVLPKSFDKQLDFEQ